MTTRTHTIAEFVAGFFGGGPQAVDYWQIDQSASWSDFVSWVAHVGDLLEEVVTRALRRGQRIAEWYEILDESTEVLREWFETTRSAPNRARLRP